MTLIELIYADFLSLGGEHASSWLSMNMSTLRRPSITLDGLENQDIEGFYTKEGQGLG